MNQDEYHQQQLEQQEQLMQSVAKKLTQVQSELKVPKNHLNSFANYRYRSCEDILEAIKPLLKKHGLSLFISDTVMQLGQRFYIEATATLTCVDTGEQIKVTSVAREPENKKGSDESQITGAASSYCRKYLLNGLFLIDDTKDADSAEPPKEQKPKPLEIDKVLKALTSAKEPAELERLYEAAKNRATPAQQEIIDFTYQNLKEANNGQ
jgi:hypothetical protein